jgi:(2Fe-2S) ferredoxin
MPLEERGFFSDPEQEQTLIGFEPQRRSAMASQKEAPYICHVFVCTNDRKGERRSCADGNSGLIRKTLKQEVGDRGWKKHVRVSKCGCMGLCANGPNVIIYPQKIWFPEVSVDDIGKILSKVEEILHQSL